jgi:hypothetical protein
MSDSLSPAVAAVKFEGFATLAPAVVPTAEVIKAMLAVG